MRTTPILATLFLCSLAAHAQSIPNGTFDSDLSGWTLPNPPDTTITWDAFGNPGGSMRIGSNWSPPGSTSFGVRTTACLDLPAGAYTLSADVFAEAMVNGISRCLLNVTHYSLPNCAESNPGGSPSELSPSGSWQHLAVDFDVFEPVTSSWRFTLVMERYPSEEPSLCYFDNVRLLGPPVQTVEVPTLNGTALFAYGSVLAAAALMALRRRVSVGR